MYWPLWMTHKSVQRLNSSQMMWGEVCDMAWITGWKWQLPFSSKWLEHTTGIQFWFKTSLDGEAIPNNSHIGWLAKVYQDWCLARGFVKMSVTWHGSKDESDSSHKLHEQVSNIQLACKTSPDDATIWAMISSGDSQMVAKIDIQQEDLPRGLWQHGSLCRSGSFHPVPNWMSKQATSGSHAKQSWTMQPSQQRFAHHMTHKGLPRLMASQNMGQEVCIDHKVVATALNMFQIVWGGKLHPICMQNKPQWYSHPGNYSWIGWLIKVCQDWQQARTPAKRSVTWYSSQGGSDSSHLIPSSYLHKQASGVQFACKTNPKDTATLALIHTSDSRLMIRGFAKRYATWHGTLGVSGSSHPIPNCISRQAASNLHAKQDPMIKLSRQ